MEITGIGFKNFRILKDNSEFELAPITVLTGANSSGKSTVIKAMKLFQTFWKNGDGQYELDFTKGQNDHELGDFDMTISKNSKDNNQIIVQYLIKNHILFGNLCVENVFVKDETNDLNNGRLIKSCIFQIEEKDERVLIYQTEHRDNKFFYYWNIEYLISALIPKLKELNIERNKYIDCRDNYQFEIGGKDFGNNGEEIEFRNYKGPARFVNDTVDFDDEDNPYCFSTALPIFNQEFCDFLGYDFERCHAMDQYFGGLNGYNTKYGSLLSKAIANDNQANDMKISLDYEGGDSISVFIMEGELYVQDAIIRTAVHPNDFIPGYPIRPATEKEQKLGVGIHNIKWILFKKWRPGEIASPKNEYNISLTESELVNDLQEAINDLTYVNIEKLFSNNIYFIPAVRANMQRLYTNASQGTSFNNLLIDFLKLNQSETEEIFFSKWVKEFEIGNELLFDRTRGVGTQIIIKQKNKGEPMNLVDMGYGVTQFLPILMDIILCANNNKQIVVIEEPETNLHPKFQSKLADLFADAYKTFGIRFIVETHSEYMIRKLQYLTATGEIKPKDTQLYYIGNPDPTKREKGEKQIIKIQIEKTGQLSQPFGSGFTDESLRWLKAMFAFSNN